MISDLFFQHKARTSKTSQQCHKKFVNAVLIAEKLDIVMKKITSCSSDLCDNFHYFLHEKCTHRQCNPLQSKSAYA
jgi:hypothetical protein